ncbi:MAG: aminopeptidase [Longimicrobiales bacterium]
MRRRILLMVLLPFVTVPTACKNADDKAATAPPPAAAVAPDLSAIAKSIVQRTAAVKEGDIVLVSGSPRDLELLEDIVIEVQKVGCSALLSMGTERMARRSLDDVPETYDSKEQKWGRLIQSNVDVIIDVDGTETAGLLEHVPPARIAARALAGAPNAEIHSRRGVRTAFVGNDLYPTHERAARFGISRDQLAAFFWGALNADFEDIRANARYVQDAIASAKELQITDPNGTSIRVGIAKKNWFVSDGVMTEESIKRKDVSKYLPAGEIYTLTDPGTAEGVIVQKKFTWGSKTIDNVTFKVAGGKLVSMTAPAGLGPAQAAYDAEVSPRKGELSVIDFGINPGIRASAASNLRTWVPEGMVSFSFGGDLWAGGTNTAPFGIGTFLANATVKADGRVIIENGNIKR